LYSLAALKSLAEFAAAAANKIKSDFSGDMRLTKISSQDASVQALASARSVLHPLNQRSVCFFD